MHGMTDEGQTDVLSRDALSFLAAYEAPRNAIEEKVAAVWAEQLKIDRVSRDDDYFELGGDSFGAVAIAAQLEAAFKVPFRSASFIEFSTVVRQAQHLASAAGSAPASPALSGIHVTGPKPPLFYVHGGMGTTFLSREFAELIEPGQPVYFFRLPGLDSGEPPLKSIEEIAALYIRQMREVQPEGPYQICANCSCGALGLEIALQLQGSGESVSHLVLIDPSAAPLPAGLMAAKMPLQWLQRTIQSRRSPGGYRKPSDPDWEDAVAEFVKGQKKAVRYTRILREHDARADEGERFSEVSDRDIEMALALLQAALDAYRPAARFEGRLDIVVSEARREDAVNWKVHARDCVLHKIPGSHNAVFAENLPLTVGALRAALGA